MTKIYVVDGDQLSLAQTSRVCADVAQFKQSVGIIAHNNSSQKRNTVISAFRTHGVINLVTPQSKNGADFALTAVLAETLCSIKAKTPRVIVVTNDKALLEAIKWLCKRHMLTPSVLKPSELR